MSLALGCYSYHDCDQNYSRPLHDSLKAYISGAVFRPQDLEPVVASAFAAPQLISPRQRLILSSNSEPGLGRGRTSTAY